MNKEIIYDCGHKARFAPRNDTLFIETDNQVVIERPCHHCRGKNKALVRAGRVARWVERRRIAQEKERERLANKPILKLVSTPEPIKLNRRMRRAL